MCDEKNSPTRIGKADLRAALLGFGYTEEQLRDANGKALKRPELLEKFNAHKAGEEGLKALSEVEEDDDDIGVSIVRDVKKVDNASNEEETTESTDEFEDVGFPKPSDPGWTQYVLGKFLEDEIDGKNPRVEGLRRVAEELVGDLIEEGCDLVAVPDESNGFRACAKAWGVFVTPNGITKRFEALADAHAENCYEDYATYLVAMADTRAKGRMFRNALFLRRVVSAEEVNKTVAMGADIQQGGSIHTGQISMIRMISDRNKISISEVLDDLSIKYEINNETGDVNLHSLAYEDALVTAKRMREIKEAKEKK